MERANRDNPEILYGFRMKSRSESNIWFGKSFHNNVLPPGQIIMKCLSQKGLQLEHFTFYPPYSTKAKAIGKRKDTV